MAKIRHPRVARVYAVGRDSGWYWYAMDLLPGGSLQERVSQQGPLKRLATLSVMDGVLEGLEAVHAAGLIHRDVKPANVMLDTQGRPVLVDFGLARHPRGSVPFRTVADVGMGTLGFIAPEQREDASTVDARADLFSAGALLGWLLTGRPIEGVSWRPDLRPEGMLDAVPPDLHPIVERATAYSPEDRYQSAREMRADIQEQLALQGPSWWRKIRAMFEG